MNDLDELKIAHKPSMKNRDRLESSGLCGCFYCLAVFKPDLIETWIDDEQTAMCPFCNIDSILPSSTDAKWITDEFLAKMQHHWFSV